jgi:hypothetical protein
VRLHEMAGGHGLHPFPRHRLAPNCALSLCARMTKSTRPSCLPEARQQFAAPRDCLRSGDQVEHEAAGSNAPVPARARDAPALARWRRA